MKGLHFHLLPLLSRTVESARDELVRIKSGKLIPRVCFQITCKYDSHVLQGLDSASAAKSQC